MAWPETTLKHWSEYLRFLEELDAGPPSSPPYFFRGQSRSSWPLRHSLSRALPRDVSRERAGAIEKTALEHFQGQANLHMDNLALRKIEDGPHWWAWMQHYGAATRLIDWTVSPYVGAYFAVKDDSESDGAIWLFNTKSLLKLVDANSGGRAREPAKVGEFWAVTEDPGSPSNFILPFEMGGASDRMVAQQGRFTVCLNVLADHGEVIDGLLSDPARAVSARLYHKLVIPQRLKGQFMKRLRAMNITANSLFPGIDGFGKSINELIRLEGYHMENLPCLT